MLRRFHLERKIDVSGTSGTGRVADGCVFSDSTTILHWNSEFPSTNIYHSIQDLIRIHSHGTCTAIVWDDPEEEDKKD